ncbi:hypothetical protein K2P47_04730 [Patescibacteria group bacterium]|nr:hypothetical protein [Patescibacteria group bacterium]
MADYGMGGCFTAVDWIKVTGKEGLKTLKSEDLALLREQGIINQDGEIEPDRLTLALMENNHVPQ